MSTLLRLLSLYILGWRMANVWGVWRFYGACWSTKIFSGLSDFYSCSKFHILEDGGGFREHPLDLRSRLFSSENGIAYGREEGMELEKPVDLWLRTGNLLSYPVLSQRRWGCPLIQSAQKPLAAWASQWLCVQPSLTASCTPMMPTRQWS